MSYRDNLKKILTEAKEIINNMLENIDNSAATKFLAGKLALTTEVIFDIIQKN